MAESDVAMEVDKPQVEGDSDHERDLVELSPDLGELGVPVISELMHLLDVISDLRVTGMLGIHLTELRHIGSELADLVITPSLFCRVTVGLKVGLKLVEIGYHIGMHLGQVLIGVERRMEHSQVGEGEAQVKQDRDNSS